MKKILSIIVIIIILVGAGYYFWQQNYSQSQTDYIIEGINPLELIVFEVMNEDVTEFQRNRAEEKFNRGKNGIEKNTEDGLGLMDNANYYFWLDIATAQKMIQDYERTAQIWTWFTYAYPHNSLSPANLADLYKSFIVDNEKSEKYYKIALARDTTDWNIYYGFFELYKYNLNDSERAIAILKDGMDHHPSDIRYPNRLVDYLVGLDRIDDARIIVEEYISQNPGAIGLRDRLK